MMGRSPSLIKVHKVWLLAGIFGLLIILITGGLMYTRRQHPEPLVWLAYSAQDNRSTLQLFRMIEGISPPQQITFSHTNNLLPVWSADGSRLAFNRWSPRNGGKIWLMSPDGRHAAPLDSQREQDVNNMAWSPDGKWLVFSAGTAQNNYELYKIRVDGTHLQQITFLNTRIYSPSWSPDSLWLTFRADHTGRGDIYKMRADGSDLTRLTDDPAPDFTPAWSPDGAWIAFASARDDGEGDIFRMRPDGSEVKRLTSEPEQSDSPDWLYDGAWIAFSRFENNRYHIYKMTPDGSLITPILPDQRMSYNPNWSPPIDRPWQPENLLLIGTFLTLSALYGRKLHVA